MHMPIKFVIFMNFLEQICISTLLMLCTYIYRCTIYGCELFKILKAYKYVFQ